MMHGQTTTTTTIPIILPSSVTGSPCYMHEKNAMMLWDYVLDLESHIYLLLQLQILTGLK